MILPYLPDSRETDLTPFGYEGVFVTWRPMDLTDKARWADLCATKQVSPMSSEGRVIGIQQQFISMRGMEVTDALGQVTPFVKEHLHRMPYGLIKPLWEIIELDASLSDVDAKNSERLSAPEDPSGTASSVAEPVPESSATTSTAS